MLKILYIDPDMKGMDGNYNYYIDLYKELCKVADCYSGLPEKCPFGPDAVVYGLGWFNKPRFVSIPINVPEICFVHKISKDWWGKERFLKTCDLVLSSLPKLPIEHTLFKYAADPKVFYPRGEKIYDFGFSGALHNIENYPPNTFRVKDLRKRVQELVYEQKNVKSFLNGSDFIKPRILGYEKYAARISQSRIWLATTGPNGDVGPRYYEVWASKTLLFCDRVPDEYRDTFRNGVNCIEFADDLSDFLPKLRYYLKNEGARKTIVNNAYEDFIAGHTWRHRAEELCSIIKNMPVTKTT